MDLVRECLTCGRQFTGRQCRMYCSATCKNAENYRRRRLRVVRVGLEHARRQTELAKLRDDVMSARFYGWRVRQLQQELYVLTSAAQAR